jgi:16S rRNA (cytosine1402-N4)-methyltransferase
MVRGSGLLAERQRGQTVVQPLGRPAPLTAPFFRAMSSTVHTSVLPAESLSFLGLRPGDRVVDGTLGGGGHTRLLAEAVGPTGLVIAIDRDPGAIARGAELLAGLPVRFAQANYRDLPEVLDALSIDAVDGVLLDAAQSKHILEAVLRAAEDAAESITNDLAEKVAREKIARAAREDEERAIRQMKRRAREEAEKQAAEE